MLQPIYLVGSKSEWGEERALKHTGINGTPPVYPKKVTTVENVATKTILGT